MFVFLINSSSFHGSEELSDLIAYFIAFNYSKITYRIFIWAVGCSLVLFEPEIMCFSHCWAYKYVSILKVVQHMLFSIGFSNTSEEHESNFMMLSKNQSFSLINIRNIKTVPLYSLLDIADSYNDQFDICV